MDEQVDGWMDGWIDRWTDAVNFYHEVSKYH
jgi:hypothetical protein